MKTTKFTCLALLILTVLNAHGEPFRTDINPALLYYQAFLMEPHLSEADSEYLYNFETNILQGQKLPERYGTIVSNYDAGLELVRQAAQQKVPCDWGIDTSRGAETLLPHLAQAKRAATGARYQAMWDLQNGKGAEARDDLIAGLALGRNVSQNNTLISVLVEFAIESIVNTAVAENFHRFSPETLQQLADGFAAAPPLGTVAACAPGEKLLHNWTLAQIEEWKEQYPGNNAAALEVIHKQMWPNGDNGELNKQWEALTNAAGGTIDGVIGLIRNSEPLTAKAFKILALPYGEYEKQMQLFTAEVEKSKNPYLSQYIAIWQACRRREFWRLVDSAMVRAAIEYKLHGETGLKSVMDPCGDGPFVFQRFVFEGVDRGFELKSPHSPGRGPGLSEAYIFVEKDGPPFYVIGANVGQPLSQ